MPQIGPKEVLAAASAGLVALDSFFVAPSPTWAAPRVLPPNAEHILSPSRPDIQGPGPEPTQWRFSAHRAAPNFDEISQGAELRLGDRGAAVAQLRNYLTVVGYPAESDEVNLFDEALGEVLARFQRDQQLIPQGPSPHAGVLGRQTLARLGQKLLDAVADEKYVIRPGEAGPHVAELQRLLTQRGYGVKVTGIFGPTTAERMSAFKASRGLTEGPAVGRHTLDALRDSTDITVARALGRNMVARLDSRRLSVTKPSVAKVREVIERAGGQWNPGSEAINILALRRPTNAREAMTGRYDDWAFVAFRGKVYALEMNTDPSGQYMHRVGWRAPQGVDADNNGVLDQGWRPEGYNVYYRGYSQTLGRVMIPVKPMDLYRDINADGRIDGQDRGATASDEFTVLLHAGGYRNTYSAACQTFGPDNFELLWSLIGKAQNADRVGYTLVDIGR